MTEQEPPVAWKNLRLFIRLSRPLFLLGGILLFGLGAAIASYLGRPVDLGRYIVGQLLVTLLQMMTQYLNEYFDSPADEHNPTRTLLTGGSGAIGPEGLARNVALYAAVISLGLAATIATASLITSTLPASIWPILLLAFLGGFFYSAPPLRLVSSGYGELVASLIVGGLTPAFGFVVQTGEIHRLLLMSTTPLIALGFAMLLVFELPDYATDVKHEKRNLMVRIGWSSAMRAHDLAIFFGLASFAIAFMFGLPRRVSLGALIVVPLAIAQIWQMRRIRLGYPPRWNSLTLSGLALFVIATYIELAGYLLS
jgi:1,4-dihydroxy-2-naphthoate octaprenyltransferase